FFWGGRARRWGRGMRRSYTVGRGDRRRRPSANAPLLRERKGARVLREGEEGPLRLRVGDAGGLGEEGGARSREGGGAGRVGARGEEGLGVHDPQAPGPVAEAALRDRLGEGLARDGRGLGGAALCEADAGEGGGGDLPVER